MTNSHTILLAEDDKTVRDVVTTTLQLDGYQIFPAMSGKRIMEILDSSPVDLILLDLILPDAYGLDLIEQIRTRTNVPIIILSGKNSVSDKVAGLKLGVDDYIGKPFHPTELRARVEANIRRYQFLRTGPNENQKSAQKATQLRFCEWIIDRRKQGIYDKNHSPAPLTHQEFRLLEALIVYAPRIMSRQDLNAILSNSIDTENTGGDRAIDICITRLRKKTGDNAQSPHIIKTCRGQGYQIICDIEVIA